MKKSFEELPKNTKLIIYRHLVSVDILTRFQEQDDQRRICEQFDRDIRLDSPNWSEGWDEEQFYKMFFDWLRHGEHSEKTRTLFDHVRAFKAFTRKKATEAANATTNLKYEKPARLEKAVDLIPQTVDNSGLKMLDITIAGCRSVIKNIEFMRGHTPEPGSIGGSMKASNQFLDSWYRNAHYTLERRTNKNGVAK